MLATMAAGTSIVVTGAGGTGKTTVVSRYIAKLGREGGVEVHRIALQKPADRGVVRGFAIDSLAAAAEASLDALARRIRTILVIDEYTLIEPCEYPCLELYDQVIATGDPAQDCAAGIREASTFVDFMEARGALSFNADKVWRSFHLPANCVLDYYAYGGRGSAAPASTTRLPDVHRSNSVPPGPENAALAIFARLVKARRVNPSFTYTVALRDAETQALVLKMMLLHRYENGTKLNCRFVDPAYMQGLETDVLLVNCQDFDRIYRTPESIVRCAFTTLGRAKTRTEFLFAHGDPTARNGRLCFSLLIKMMLTTVPEQRNADPAFAEAVERLSAKRIDLIPIDGGVMLYSRASNSGFRVIRSAEFGDEDDVVNVVLDIDRMTKMGWAEAETEAWPPSLAGVIRDDTPDVVNAAAS